MPTPRQQKLSNRTVDIVNTGGRILLKRGEWYLQNWSNLAAGPDKAVWGIQREALSISNLEWAFAIAPLYSAKVVVVYPKGK